MADEKAIIAESQQEAQYDETPVTFLMRRQRCCLHRSRFWQIF